MTEALNSFIREFNNREFAVAIWVIIAMAGCVLNSKIRKPLFQLIKAFFKWKLTASYLIMFAYIAVIVSLLSLTGMWKLSHLPITFLWVLCVAFFMLFRYSGANDPHFFIKGIKDNIKGLVFLEFIVNLYVFSIWVELILVPVFAVLGCMLAIADTNKDYQAIKNLLNFIIGCFCLYFVGHAIYMAIIDFRHFASVENLENFYLPIILSVTFLPFVYFAALFSGYEMLFIRLGYFVPDRAVLKYAKLKTIIAFNFNLWELNRWSEHIYSTWRFKSKKEVDEAILGFKKPA